MNGTQQNNPQFFRFLWVILIYIVLVGSGTLGYRWLESWSWADAAYMTIITISTVGFSEVAPLSDAGKWFTMVLIVLGVGGFTYTFTAITDYLIKGQLQDYFRERRKKMEIQLLQNHYIVCGFGRVGLQVAQELRQDGHQILIVEEDEAAASSAVSKGYLVLKGNANDDDLQQEMGLDRAAGLIATLNTDEANLMLVLSARSLNSELNLVARSNYEFNERKLKTAGADRVISPYSIGGRRMAQLVTRPNVVEFLDVVMHSENQELWMEDFSIKPGSKLDGCKIAEMRVREHTGVNIVGIRNSKGRYVVSPDPSSELHANDVIMALGTREQLSKLKELSQ